MKTTLSKCINLFEMREEVDAIQEFLLCRTHNFSVVKAKPNMYNGFFWINTGYYIFIPQNYKFVTLIDFFL